MAGRDGHLRLGLPKCLSSPVASGSGLEVASLRAKLGPVPCRLGVYRRVREARNAAQGPAPRGPRAMVREP